jgi:hypothetical protein
MTGNNDRPWKRLRVPLALMLLPCAMAAPANAQSKPAEPGDDPAGKPNSAERFVIEMQPCKAERRGRLKTSMGIIDILKGIPNDDLVRKGDFVVDGRTFTFYLPKADAYPIKNTGKYSTHHDNTSTLISIDANGDGQLSDDEGWYASLPVRVGDAMFKIAAIPPDGSRIELRRSKSPLRGVVVGWKCPPFSFKAQDGRKITLDDYQGKAFLIDIWSVT